MKLTPTRTGLFLAISAMFTPVGAFGQAAPPVPESTPATVAQPALAASAADTARTLDAVEVRSEYIPEPMLQTSAVASFVTREDFARQGDDTAAAALTRVTGLSLSQGKFVYVRGLGERYSSALFNGSPLPSPEPLQRVIPLDLFPSNVLDSVTVQKTYSARYPGEFGGGVIDLQSITTPDEPFLTLKIGGGGNSETTSMPGLTYYGSQDDWSGFDDGTRKAQAPLRDAMDSGQRIDGGNFSDEELKRIGRSFVNAPLNLIQQTDDVDFDGNVEASAGSSFDMDWGKMGLFAVAGYDNSWRTREGVQQEGLVENGAISPRTDYDFLSTQNDVAVNALIGAGAEWGENRINLTTLYVHNTSKEARSREGYDELAGADVRDDYTEWFERELVNTQLSGKHAFGEYRDLTIDWRLAYARASREAPYEKGIRYRLVDGRYQHNASQEQNYTRFSTVDDRVASGGIDATWRLPIERDATLTFGVAKLDNDREAQAREFRFLALNGSLPQNNRLQRVDFLLSDFNISQGLLTLRETTGADGAAAYDASLEVDAAYAQLESEIVENVRATAGVRFEDATQTVQPIDLFGGNTPLPTAAPLENDYFLPAGTLTWTFGDNMQLRFGASQTIARPQFRELAPQQYLDTDSDRLYIGNPFLVDSELVNLDARFEWYFGSNEYFTLGGFYKDIDKPVESIVNEAGATIQQTFINAPNATLYGAEVDYRKYFELPFSADWLGDSRLGDSRLYFAANYTYSKSEVTVEEGDVTFPLSGNGQPRPAAELVRDGSQMQGQSEHLANLQFGIEDEATRSQATLLIGYAGERISARGRPGQPDFIQEPGTMVDLVVRKGFNLGTTEMTIGFEARNLLGEEYQEYQELGGGRVDLNRYDLGTSYSLSLTASF